MSEIIVKICPTVEELESASEYYCSEATCAGVKFKNVANLEMHRVRHHKFNPADAANPGEKREFHCPIPNCNYNLSAGKCSSFSSRKYLKQHYQKVHASKIFECCVCHKKQFSTKVLLENHERTCGNYQCNECSYKYTSKEALLSHVRRKHHGNVSISGLKRNRQKQGKNNSLPASTSEIGIQTTTLHEDPCFQLNTEVATTQHESIDINRGSSGDSLAAQFIDNYCQTMTAEGYFEDSFSCFNSAVTSGGAVSSIETQTDLLDDLIQNSDTLMSSIYSNDRHTQTCDEILSELLVNDIQTQTMWSGITADCATDMLVSTETQTGLFGGVNNSIQTQTIDAFLGTSSTSFNSTHTQT